jgi:hypothetical protein
VLAVLTDVSKADEVKTESGIRQLA